MQIRDQRTVYELKKQITELKQFCSDKGVRFSSVCIESSKDLIEVVPTGACVISAENNFPAEMINALSHLCHQKKSFVVAGGLGLARRFPIVFGLDIVELGRFLYDQIVKAVNLDEAFSHRRIVFERHEVYRAAINPLLLNEHDFVVKSFEWNYPIVDVDYAVEAARWLMILNEKENEKLLSQRRAVKSKRYLEPTKKERDV